MNMTKKAEVIRDFEGLLSLTLTIDRASKNAEIQFITASGPILFAIRPKEIVLFRSKFEGKLQQELNNIFKTVQLPELKPFKNEVMNDLSAIANKRLIAGSSFLKFSKEISDNTTRENALFQKYVSEHTRYTLEEAKAILERWSKETLEEQLDVFLRRLEKILGVKPGPNPSLKNQSLRKNPLKLGPAEDNEDRVRGLYYQMKANGYIKGGTAEAFVDFFSGKNISTKNKFDLTLEHKCHVYYFFVELAEKQSSILFPRNKTKNPTRRQTIIPWKLIKGHFTYCGEPLTGIERNCGESRHRYITNLIKILRPVR